MKLLKRTFENRATVELNGGKGEKGRLAVTLRKKSRTFRQHTHFQVVCRWALVGEQLGITVCQQLLTAGQYLLLTPGQSLLLFLTEGVDQNELLTCRR